MQRDGSDTHLLQLSAHFGAIVLGVTEDQVQLAAVVLKRFAEHLRSGGQVASINPSLTQEINAESVKNLTKNYSGRIVFLSTCSVYGAQEGVLSEDSSTNPLSE